MLGRAGQDQISDSGQAQKCIFPGAAADAEPGYFGNTPGDQGGTGIVSEVESVRDTGGHGNHINPPHRPSPTGGPTTSRSMSGILLFLKSPQSLPVVCCFYFSSSGGHSCAWNVSPLMNEKARSQFVISASTPTPIGGRSRKRARRRLSLTSPAPRFIFSHDGLMGKWGQS